jgi:uncharacterized protein (TIRG00374 family)
MSWRLWLAIGLTLCFSALALAQVDDHALMAAIGDVSPGWWLLAAPLFALAHVARGWRWAALLKPLTSAPTRNVIAYSILGMWVNDLIPARAGELYRAWLLKSRENLPMPSGLATVVVERALDGLLAVGLLTVASFLLDIDDARIVAARVSGLSLFGLVLATLVLMGAAPGHMARLADALARLMPKKAGDGFKTLVHEGILGLGVLKQPRVLTLALLRTFLIWGLLTAFYWVMLHAMNLPAHTPGAMLVLGVVSLAAVLPTAPGHVGVYHYACMSAVALLGVSDSRALAFAVLAHVTELSVTLLMGLALLFALGLSLPGRNILRRAAALSKESTP